MTHKERHAIRQRQLMIDTKISAAGARSAEKYLRAKALEPESPAQLAVALVVLALFCVSTLILFLAL